MKKLDAKLHDYNQSIKGLISSKQTLGTSSRPMFSGDDTGFNVRMDY